MKLSILMAGGGDILRDGYRARAFNWVRKRYLDLVGDDCEFVIGTSDHEPYNRSAARNVAFGRSSGEVLLVADADTVPQAFAIHAALERIEAGAPWVIPYGLGRYYNLTKDASRRILDRRDPLARVGEPSDPGDWEHQLDSWAGMLLVPRGAWETVGGYDEAFIGWGYDDDAMRWALDRKVGEHVRCDGHDAYALHLFHPRSEAENFGQPMIEHNRQRADEYRRGLR